MACAVEGCENPARKRGWCTKHYQRWRRAGDPLVVREVIEECSVEGCKNPHAARGFCNNHYANWRRQGNPLGRGPLDLRDMFWSRVNKQGPIPDHCPAIGCCWVWTGKIKAGWNGGYGIFYWKGKDYRANRVSWRLSKGKIGSLCVLHKCDNRACVRPSHLFLGSRADNMEDKMNKGRGWSGMTGKKHTTQTRAAMSEAQRLRWQQRKQVQIPIPPGK